MRRGRTFAAMATAGVLLLTACASNPRPISADPTTTGTTAPTSTAPTSTAPTSTAPPTAAVAVTAVAATVPPTTVPPTTVPPTTVPATTVPATTGVANTTVATTAAGDVRTLGMSVQGRPITALHRGTPGGHVVVVIGVIHGSEAAGLAITARLATMALPDDIDLWIVDSMNPDGQAADDRHNADQVDLNRNFPFDWGPFESPGGSEYAGSGPASEPETQAMVSFITEVHPEMVIWYHQDLDRIAPSTGRDGRIRARYAELTGVPLVNITGGHYTGVAATWARHALDGGVAFIVELGPTLDDEQADAHATAIVTLAGELG